MAKYQKFLLAITLLVVFLVVYSPHFNYSFPFHVDEWHHISEALRFQQPGAYFNYLTMESVRRASGLEIGFHFILFLISLVFNLVLVYKFLPAIWAVVSAAVLFWVVYKKTGSKFLLAWLAVVFFGSIKSNVNLTGLWFFTPLTFCIPFVFLYFYFFSEGIEKKNKKLILLSLAMMSVVVVIHPASISFAIPILALYLIFNYRYLFSELKFFSVFLILLLVGIIFYQIILGLSWLQFLPSLLDKLQFKSGWGVLELKNTPTEIYSWLGYLLALVGAVAIISEKQTKKYLIYLIWPVVLFLALVLYRFTGVSYLSPYQRNWYYFAISLPLLSALGLGYIIDNFIFYVNDFITSQPLRKYFYQIGLVVIVGLVFLLSFADYYSLPQQAGLYQVINQNDYNTLLYLKTQPKGLVLALPFISTALYPLAAQEPIGTIAFYGNRQDVEKFFLSENCSDRQLIIDKHKPNYIISPYPIDCPFISLIKQIGSNYIYQAKKI
ncbi:MAG: hypothetical protein WC508_05860 [Patescibacteria group bacterium]